MARRTKTLTGNDNLAGYVFIMPWLVGFLAFIIVPMISSLYFSFSKYDLLSIPRFIGFSNYIRMFFQDGKYWVSLRVTFTYVLAGVPLRLAFALFVAILLNKRYKLIGFYRVVFYLPSLLGGSVAIAVMWRQLFGLDGALNSFLQLLGIEETISWIGDPSTALWSLILLHTWQFGSSMLIFFAGLKGIPATYYEAAIVDGANAWQKFIRITIPLLSPVIFFNLVMQTINGFRAFTQAYIVTGGGPINSTLFYALYVYRRAFEYFEMGYGSALAWILLFIIGVFTALIFKSSPGWVYYESKDKF